jgi:hypothetical protein
VLFYLLDVSPFYVPVALVRMPSVVGVAPRRRGLAAGPPPTRGASPGKPLGRTCPTLSGVEPLDAAVRLQTSPPSGPVLDPVHFR